MPEREASDPLQGHRDVEAVMRRAYLRWIAARLRHRLRVIWARITRYVVALRAD
jgi:hypothetical protein